MEVATEEKKKIGTQIIIYGFGLWIQETTVKGSAIKIKIAI